MYAMYAYLLNPLYNVLETSEFLRDNIHCWDIYIYALMYELDHMNAVKEWGKIKGL